MWSPRNCCRELAKCGSSVVSWDEMWRLLGGFNVGICSGSWMLLGMLLMPSSCCESRLSNVFSSLVELHDCLFDAHFASCCRRPCLVAKGSWHTAHQFSAGIVLPICRRVWFPVLRRSCDRTWVMRFPILEYVNMHPSAEHFCVDSFKFSEKDGVAFVLFFFSCRSSCW